MSNLLDRLAADNVRLPSPPAIAVRILEAVRNEKTSFAELARIIAADPALTARILKVANSSFYSLSYKIDTIEKALTILGVGVLKNIALSFVIARDVHKNAPSDFDFDRFWRRALTAAVAAQLIAVHLQLRNEETFVAALLQDIGVVVLCMNHSDDYPKLLSENAAGNRPLAEAERERFGFDHQQLGAELLEHWGLPENICRPIRYHHDRRLAPAEWQQQADILFLADCVSAIYHGSHSTERIGTVKNLLGRGYGVPDAEVEELIDTVAAKASEIFDTFDLAPQEMKPFSQLLQEANEELRRLNLSYEYLVMEYKQAKETAERLSGELRTVNEKLRNLAFRDGLTGLYNHRYFQEMIGTELLKARRYQRPLSLVMVDIDHFKKVNDNFGHQCGDMVLRQLSELIARLIRATDSAARYGGEEFAVVLPETEPPGARVLAERLRNAVIQNSFSTPRGPLYLTISLGVSCYLPACGDVGKDELIEATDTALYQAKTTGRNRSCLLELEEWRCRQRASLPP